MSQLLTNGYTSFPPGDVSIERIPPKSQLLLPAAAPGDCADFVKSYNFTDSLLPIVHLSRLPSFPSHFVVAGVVDIFRESAALNLRLNGPSSIDGSATAWDSLGRAFDTCAQESRSLRKIRSSNFKGASYMPWENRPARVKMAVTIA